MDQNEKSARRIIAGLERGHLTRREALRALSAAGLSLTAFNVLTGNAFADAATTGATGAGGIPLARPNKPVKLPLHNEMIKSGLEAEKGGTFNIYNYADYVDPALLDAFGKKYGVDVKVTTFDSMDEAVTKLGTHTVQDMDVTEMTPDRLAQVVAGKVLMPINKDYIPNLKKNCWPQFMSPFYDVDAQYTVPYTIYTTGIGWRSDKVSEDIAKMDNPWDIFWQAEKYKGFVSVLDDSREALVLGLMHQKQYDFNTEDPQIIQAALDDILKLIDICNVKVNITSYQTIPEGKCYLAHNWSGNMLSGALAFMPKGVDPGIMNYWAPPAGKGPIQNDTWAVCATAKKPVLAHLWLDFILDEQNAFDNFINFNGYQPPMNSITPESLVADKRIPETLQSAVMKPEDLGPDSLQECTLTTTGLKLWQSAYAKFNAG
ncbi:MAG TPA: spermidine/putrescine ABC transporter substrate-binding protein [Dongiaceae bacterium]